MPDVKQSNFALSHCRFEPIIIEGGTSLQVQWLQDFAGVNSTQLNSTGNYGRRCKHLSRSHQYVQHLKKHNQLITTPDWFPVPVRSAVKSYLITWCDQNLSNRALNVLTVLALTTALGRLFQILTIRAEKQCLRKS